MWAEANVVTFCAQQVDFYSSNFFLHVVCTETVNLLSLDDVVSQQHSPSHTLIHTHNKLRNIWWNRWATWKEKRTTHNTHFRYHRRWLLETILHIVIPAVEYNNLIYLIYMYKNNNTWMKLHKHENSYENANTNTHPSVKWRNYLPGAEEVNVNIEVNWCNSIKRVFYQMS